MKSKKQIVQLLAPLLSLLFLFSSVELVHGTATCLYCKRADNTATFLTSYSYCASSDKCLQDKWLYIDRPCSSGWKYGEDLALLANCKPKKTSCHPFVSKEQAAG